MADEVVPVHPGPTITAPEVRGLPFSSPNLRSSIERSLAQLKDGETWAFVAVGEKQGDEVIGRMTINVKLFDKDAWSFGGYIEASNKEKYKVGVEIRLAG